MKKHKLRKSQLNWQVMMSRPPPLTWLRAVGGGLDVGRLQRTLTFGILCPAPQPARFRALYPAVRFDVATKLSEARVIAAGTDSKVRCSLHPPDRKRTALLPVDLYDPVCAPGSAVTLDTATHQIV